MNLDQYLSVDSDYAYIGTFLAFLQILINMIKDLFSGLNLGGDKEEDDAAKE